MSKAPKPLRRGWTTGACATAAVKAAAMRLWGGDFPERVKITLPRGETPEFAIARRGEGAGWAEAGVVKDAGDDPDVTHGALIVARVGAAPSGLSFAAGPGVGVITRPGLPLPPGEPAINPVPRRMMARALCEAWREVHELPALKHGDTSESEGCDPDHWTGPGVVITISVPGGEALAGKTWNPRLGIVGGLSILGTTGIVRPFSCSAWIASIHRGVDVARAAGLPHVAGCTGSTSERAVQALFGLPDHAMLDMGDFAGGLLKYLRKHPLARLTIGGGIGKMTKLAQGAVDLHSGRSQVDFSLLADWLGDASVKHMNTALEVYEKHGINMSSMIAERARLRALDLLRDTPVSVDVVIVDRAGAVIARAGP